MKRTKDNRKATVASSLARTQRACEYYRSIFPVIKTLRAAGKTLAEIAEHLNNQGLRTSRGHPFHKTAVYRILNSNGYQLPQTRSGSLTPCQESQTARERKVTGSRC